MKLVESGWLAKATQGSRSQPLGTGVIGWWAAAHQPITPVPNGWNTRQRAGIRLGTMTTGTGTFVTRGPCRTALPEDFRFEAAGVPLTDDFTTVAVLVRIMIDRQNTFTYKCD